MTTSAERTRPPYADGLLRVAALSVEEGVEAVDTGDTSGIEFLEPALELAGEFTAYRDKVTDYDDLIRRYVSRMAGRATPFGLFAGVAPLRIGRRRRLELAPRAEHQVRVRIDVGALEAVLEEALTLRPTAVALTPNPTLRLSGGHLRYSKTGNANAAIVEIRATRAISVVVDLCRERPLSENALVEILGRAGGDTEQLHAFVRQLIVKEVLLPETTLLFHGVEPVDLALGTLSEMGSTDYAAALDKLAGRTCRVWPLPEFQRLDLRRPWEDAVADIPALGPVSHHHRFHVDLEMAAPEATIEESCVSAMHVAANKLLELFPPDDHEASFKEAFRARYEDAAAPLLDALDPDRGVLLASRRRSSQLAGAVAFRGAAGPPARQELAQAAVRALALSVDGAPVDVLLEPSGEQRAQAARHPAHALHAALLDRYENRYSALLYASYGHGSLGPISRFALAREDLLPAPVQGPAVDDPNAPIVAELLFGPDGRYGNIVMRPRLHEHSISVSGARQGTITLDSLDISVTSDNRIVLWHRPTGRRVVPELNTAHNVLAYHNSPIYTFLARIANWGASMWDWGALSRQPHLPRVVCGSVIVSQERWLLTADRLAAVLAARHPARELRNALPRLGERRWLGFGKEDNILVVDTHSDHSIRALLPRAGRRATAFVEMPQVERPATRSDRGHHVTEVMIPLSAPATRTRTGTRPPTFDPTVGRDWVYARYHCGSGSVDQVVRRARELVRRLRQAGVAREWFFVRYDDGVHHARVRVAPTAPEHRPAVQAALESLGHTLLDEAVASRVVFDTYVPEPGRYAGYDGLRLAERLFSADSDAVCAYLADAPDESTRLDQAVIDALAWSGRLTANLDEQIRLLTSWRDTMGLVPTKRTGKLARERRRPFEALPVLDEALAGPLDAYLAHLRGRTHGERRHALGSAMHMHFNRLFEVDARRLEWLAYEFALRAARGWQARRQRQEAS